MEEVYPLLQAIKRLVNGSVTGAGVVTAFHARRVQPLMWREHRLEEMVLGVSLARTVLCSEEHDREAIQKCIKLALGCAPDDVTLDLHPSM